MTSRVVGRPATVDRSGTGSPSGSDPDGDVLGVLYARSGELPPGAVSVVLASRGDVLVLGDGAEAAASTLASARRVWWAETERGLRPAALADALAARLGAIPLIVMPASADGRALAPRLAAALDRPLLANAARLGFEASDEGGREVIRAELVRLDARLAIPVTVDGVAVATVIAVDGSSPEGPAPSMFPLDPPLEPTPENGRRHLDVTVLDVLEPVPGAVELAEADRIFAAGAGLVPPGTDDATAGALFELLAAVGGELGASTGATRVVSDAGWVAASRSIGVTGVMVHPELYVALGISGATQHVGGIGAPRHVVSVNLDPSSAMTARADLGIVADARALLLELARRLGVDVPPGVTRG